MFPIPIVFFWILFINSWNSNEKNPRNPPRGAKLTSVWRGFLSKLVEKPYSHHVRYHYIAKPHVLRLFGGKSLQRIGFPTFPTFILAWYGQFPISPSIWSPLLFDPTWNPPRPNKIESSGFQESTSQSKSFTSPLCLGSITGMKNYLVV